MNPIFILSFCCCLYILPFAGKAQTTEHQTLHVQVIDGETQKDIKNVKIISRFVLNKKKKINTDFLGRATLIPIVGDTITFDHPDYYHLHIVLHDHAPHDFLHPLKVSLTKMHPNHEKPNKNDFQLTTHSLHHFEPQQVHHAPLKIGVIEDSRAIEHRKSWLEKPRTDSKGFNLIDLHLRTKKE